VAFHKNYIKLLYTTSKIWKCPNSSPASLLCIYNIWEFNIGPIFAALANKKVKNRYFKDREQKDSGDERLLFYNLDKAAARGNYGGV
jgi:hypothetical protein